MLYVLIIVLVAYLLGSINFGVLISRLRHHDDVRNYGSGNAGATNTLRIYGKVSAILVLLGDLLKGTIAVIGARVLAEAVSTPLAEYFDEIAGVAVILGHLFPIFFKFKGGKGVSTTAGVVVAVSPIAFILLISLFIVMVALTKYVSLSSVTAASLIAPTCAVIQAIAGKGFDIPQIILGVIIALLVAFAHRQNIKRLINHTESKISFNKNK
ncbi:MAG: glycerol-3-phosphate 1-O-acyltransferase PlsY [Clostridia bacterium]|nr:glycerol-3-phosphate 1-O-acyltransferase PlsY [Clostridia bacterium]MBQ6708167.1 glycerol-3-phosphate 1-O-acyltransferase PlsY [Clostridia bacterium]